MKKYIGLDLGGTNLRAALVSQNGEMTSIKRSKSEVDRGPRYVVDKILDMIKSIMKENSGEKIEGVGMAIPGLLDTSAGLIRFAPNLKWHDVPIRQMIQEKIDVPVYFDNDCRVHALGEYFYGAGQGFQNFMVMALGTGIGSGIVLGGKLYKGAFECAGEIGHFQVQFPGATCSCGKRGCLETVASATGITRMAREIIGNGRGEGILREAGGRGDSVLPSHVFQAAGKGDPAAGEIIQEVIRCLSMAISMFYNTLNLEAIILSGGVSKAGDALFVPLRENIRKMAESSLGPYRDMLNYRNILPAKLGDEAGLIGGAALVQYSLSL